MFSSIFFAILSSIDSLGIGITYGIKSTKMTILSKIALFTISVICASLSIFCGDFFQLFFTPLSTKIIGSSILIILGLYICISAFREKNNSYNIFNNPLCSDLNKSNSIEIKESLFLSLSLSLDSFCIGVGGSMSDINLNFFPFWVGLFQIIFLDSGIYLGTYVKKFCNLPENIWSIISGIFLILIGLLKFIM